MSRKLFVLLIVGLLSITTACGKDTVTDKETAKEVQQVIVAEVKNQEVDKYTELSGVLMPSEETMVSFEVSGKIKALNKKEGDIIKSQEIIAILDAEGYELGVQQADANVMQADAGLKQVKKGAREQELLQAKALVEKAQAGYQKVLDDFKRVKILYQEGAVAQNVYEGAFTGLTVAEKDLTLAKQGYSLALEGAAPEVKDRAGAAYELALSAKKQANLTLAKTKLKAPFEATIVNKLAAEGQLVSAGMPIYRVGIIDELKVTLPVPDHEIKDWKVGDQVKIMLYGEAREGKVVNIFPAASLGTGTIGVEVIISNLKHDWFVGQVVTAKRKLNTKKTSFLPVEAVMSRGEERPYVYKAVNNKAVKTPVDIGELINNQYEIISGIQEGELVVVKGADRLYNGQQLQVVRGN